MAFNKQDTAVSLKRDKGITQLLDAAKSGKVKRFTDLIQQGLDPYTTDENGANVLHLACLFCKRTMATFLSNEYPDLNGKKDNNDDTALHYAAAGGHVDIFKFLAQEKSSQINIKDRDKDGESVLHKACLYGNFGMARHLTTTYQGLETRTEKNDWDLLHYAAASGSLKIFKYLTDTFTMYKNVTKVEECLTKKGRTVLHIACMEGKLDMVIQLVQTFPSLKDKTDNEGLTSLHAAVASGDVEIFKHLVLEGLDVKKVTNDGCTVLHIACLKGNQDMVKYIVKTYPSLTTKEDKNGKLAIHFAAVGRHKDIFKFLLNQGVNEACSQLNIREMVEHFYKIYPELINIQDDKQSATLRLSEEPKISADAGDIPHKSSHSGLRKGKEEEICLPNIHQHFLSHQDSLHLKTLRDSSLAKTSASFPSTLSIRSEPQSDISCYDSHDSSIPDTDPLFNQLLDQFPDNESRPRSGSSGSSTHRPRRFHSNPKRHSFHGSTKDSGIDTDSELSFPSSHPRQGSGNSRSSSNIHAPLSPSPKSNRPPYNGSSGKHKVPKDNQTWPDEAPFSSPYKTRQYINQQGKESQEVTLLLQWLCARVKSKLTFQHHQQVTVSAGYNKDSPTEPIFLAIVEKAPGEVPDTSDSFKLIVREQGHVSTEGKSIAEKETNINFTIEEHDKLQECLKKRSKHLMTKHSNLEIISASKFKSIKYEKDGADLREETCIALYVHVKGIIPFQEEPFPTELDGFTVDVREGFFEPHVYPEGYHRKLLMGCKISSANNTSGTLGGFVELENGNTGGLTCSHVFLSEENKEEIKKKGHLSNGSVSGDPVYQPDHSNERFKIGTIRQKVFDCGDDKGSIGVDAALIEITDPNRVPVSGHFPDATSPIAGFTRDKPMVFNSGNIFKSFDKVPKSCQVSKYGSATSHTTGMLRLAGSAVHRRRYTYAIGDNSSEDFELFNQFEIFHIDGQPFSCHGDSGALVFLLNHHQDDKYDIKALGMLVGGTSNNTTIVTPIWAVLDKLGLFPKLKQFPDSENTASTQTGAESVQPPLESDVLLLKLEVSELKTTMHQKLDSMDSKLEDVKSSMDSKIDSKLEEVKSSMGSKIDNLKQFFQEMLQNSKSNNSDTKKENSSDRHRYPTGDSYN